ncbi:hypothetical protein AVEN_151789-1 [Araneus ventricosus]|uniref:Uncharacterized protein n=1 Tax=Araneus ventricosus TaxID=182803 RepID=A0A4Y2J053_ARAVE|nr:hypothetical protein AVEN_151789-1 [Araneus ventricosus]
MDRPPRQSQNQFLGRCTQSLLHRDIMHQIRTQPVFSCLILQNSRILHCSDNFPPFRASRVGLWRALHALSSPIRSNCDSLSVETTGASRRNVNTKLDG